ncbi:hypothetical protein hrd7_03760 [Leptolinea sp. HRD-7]|nr:hypothetical protein hrd7_03760 [Leptolinea sp. HRD-7]
MPEWRNHLFIVILIATFLGLRIFASDPWTGAVATNDTDSYVNTANAPLFSTGFFSGMRPITVPLLYKIFTPPGGYDTSIRSEPSIGKLPGLRELPGFSNIAFAQSIISVLCWMALAISLYMKLENRWLKYVSVSLVLLSACLPEIVSWDHVMMAESLSYSLFALLIAFSLPLFDISFFRDETAPKYKKWLAAGFLLTLFFWVNTRDTNIYFLEITNISLIIGLAISYVGSKFKKISRLGVTVLVVSSLIVIFQQAGARGSTRLVNPLINNLTANVFPYSTRVEFMHDKWGMPNTPEIISNRASANYSTITGNKEFVRWVQKNGLSAYTDFMINTPEWTVQMLINSFSDTFGYYKQPYYDPSTVKLTVDPKQLTRLINWSSSDLIVISLFLTLLAIGKNLKQKQTTLWPVLGMMASIWLGAGVMYTASYLGETWGSAARHIQNVILTYRLLILVYIPVIFDS